VVHAEFVPVAVAPMAPANGDDRTVEIELRRDSVALKVLWPMSAAAELPALARELLR